jgi:hypothetical protein
VHSREVLGVYWTVKNMDLCGRAVTQNIGLLLARIVKQIMIRIFLQNVTHVATADVAIKQLSTCVTVRAFQGTA